MSRVGLARTRLDVLACVSVRWAVFVVEQGVAPVLEVDARDFEPSTAYVLARDEEGRAVGTCRILSEGPARAHLGRVAVLREARGRGVGTELVRFAHAVLARRQTRAGRAVVVRVEAQVRARGFYETLGYRTLPGPQFLDAGIPHVLMARRVQPEGRG